MILKNKLKPTPKMRKLWLTSLLLMTTFTSACETLPCAQKIKPDYSKNFLTQLDSEYDKDGPATKEVIKIWMSQNGL